MNKRPLQTLTTLGLLLTALGCSDEDGADSPVKIAWIAKGQSNTFFDISRIGANLAADDLSAASGREVVVHTDMDPEEGTPELQAEALREAIDLGVDAINVSVLDPEVVGAVIDEAVDAGIPVLTFDSDAPDSKRSTYYGIDNYEGATLLTHTLASLLGEAGKVAVMSAAQTSTSATYLDRLAGFHDTIAEYPDIEVVTTVYCSKAEEESMAGCTGQLEQVMAEYPDITGWYLARGRVLREAELGELAPIWGDGVLAGDISVVAFDAPEDAVPAITAGFTDMVIGQKQFGWGYDLVTLSFDVVTAGRDLEEFTNATYDVICDNNAEDFAARWRAQDFRTALPECDLL